MVRISQRQRSHFPDKQIITAAVLKLIVYTLWQIGELSICWLEGNIVTFWEMGPLGCSANTKTKRTVKKAIHFLATSLLVPRCPDNGKC